MIAELKNLLLKLSDERLKRLFVEHEQAITIVELAKDGLVTPTHAAYMGVLTKLKEALLANP